MSSVLTLVRRFESHSMFQRFTSWLAAKRFSAWARKQGLGPYNIEELIAFAATPEQMKAAYEAIEPAPPIYTLQGIRELHDGDKMGVSPGANGFLIVGGCPNGDPIALDLRDDVGSVWYLSHEEMHDTPLRTIAIRVADNIYGLFNGIGNDDDFPIDYYAAKKLQTGT